MHILQLFLQVMHSHVSQDKPAPHVLIVLSVAVRQWYASWDLGISAPSYSLGANVTQTHAFLQPPNAVHMPSSWVSPLAHISRNIKRQMGIRLPKEPTSHPSQHSIAAHTHGDVDCAFLLNTLLSGNLVGF
jgi:hypothetical protein